MSTSFLTKIAKPNCASLDEQLEILERHLRVHIFFSKYEYVSDVQVPELRDSSLETAFKDGVQVQGGEDS